jgi:hypothetical protein
MLHRALLVLVLSGCNRPSDGFDHVAEWDGRPDGVVIVDSVETLFMGMNLHVCGFDVEKGKDNHELDVIEEAADVLLDGHGASMAVLAPEGVRVLDPEDEFDVFTAEDRGVLHTVAEVREARLMTDGGLVVLTEACAVVWFQDAVQQATVDVPCGTSFAIDRGTGVAFIAEGNRVTVADPAGTVVLDHAFDQVAFDEATGLLYGAHQDETTVTAISVDGTVRWAIDVGGAAGDRVFALDDMGVNGNVAYATEGDYHGRLGVLDGATGEARMAVDTPGGVERLIVGLDGRSWVVIVGPEVHLMKLDVELE